MYDFQNVNSKKLLSLGCWSRFLPALDLHVPKHRAHIHAHMSLHQDFIAFRRYAICCQARPQTLALNGWKEGASHKLTQSLAKIKDCGSNKILGEAGD